jgi:hypothetical protein
MDVQSVPPKDKHFVNISVLRSVLHSADSCSEKYIIWRMKVIEEETIRMATSGFLLLALISCINDAFWL